MSDQDKPIDVSFSSTYRETYLKTERDMERLIEETQSEILRESGCSSEASE